MSNKDFKTCTKCGETKLLPEFRRVLSLAQTKSLKRVGNVRLVVSSKNCKDCQPKRKPPRELTLKDLKGRVSTLTFDKMKEAREAKARMKQGVVRREAWERQWRTELRTILAPMQREIRRMSDRLRYIRRTTADTQLFNFTQTYLLGLRQQKSNIEWAYYTKPSRPTHSWWQEMVDPEWRSKMSQLWMALPPAVHHLNLNMPELLLFRAPLE
jgi:hypothetical protein